LQVVVEKGKYLIGHGGGFDKAYLFAGGGCSEMVELQVSVKKEKKKKGKSLNRP